MVGVGHWPASAAGRPRWCGTAAQRGEGEGGTCVEVRGRGTCVEVMGKGVMSGSVCVVVVGTCVWGCIRGNAALQHRCLSGGVTW